MVAPVTDELGAVRWRVSLQAMQGRWTSLHRRDTQEDRIQAIVSRVCSSTHAFVTVRSLGHHGSQYCPTRYAEVLEHTQLALVATVHKLYAMVRSGEQWDFGEPDLNDRGQPVVHNIAQKLGCIRPNSDIDLPVHSVFPEDEQGLASLASQLEAQQQAQKATASSDHLELDTRTDRASSSDDDHSDAGDFQKMTFSGGSYQHADNTATLSPASLTRHSFDMHSAQSSEDMSRTTSPTTNTMPNEFSQYFGPALMGNSFNNPSFGQPTAFTTLSMLQSPALASLDSMDIFSQSPLEPQFSPTESHAMGRPNPDLMFSEDPMLFANLDVDMRPVTSGY